MKRNPLSPEMLVKSHLVLIMVSILVVGCEDSDLSRELHPENHKQAPLFVEADGQSYLVCSGFVDISTPDDKDGTYGLRFTDATGTSHDIRGVKRFHTSTMPKHIQEWRDEPFPSHLPNPKLESDNEGKPYQDGYTYTWPDGSKAVFKNGKWEHAKYWYDNDPCKKTP